MAHADAKIRGPCSLTFALKTDPSCLWTTIEIFVLELGKAYGPSNVCLTIRMTLLAVASQPINEGRHSPEAPEMPGPRVFSARLRSVLLMLHN